MSPDYRPIVLDAETLEPLPVDSPTMKTVYKIWEAASPEEQEAFHRVTVQNSRRAHDMFLMRKLAERMSKAVMAN